MTPEERSCGNTNDDGVPNFAHAALILQNSSHVYSRKVEYLHTLVYKALQDFFQSTASANNTNARRRKSADTDVEEFFGFDPHDNFLLLDDVIPEDLTLRKINLKGEDESADLHKESHDDTPSTSRRDRTFSSVTSRNNTTRLSLGGLSVTRLERSTLGVFYSSAGSLQQQRALLGILNSGTLRLVDGQCDVDDSGVLLMPGSQTDRGSVTIGGDNRERQPTEDFASGQPRSLFGADNLDTENNGQEGATFDDHGDDDNDGPGFVINDDVDDNVIYSLDHDSASRGENVKRVTFSEHAKENKSEKKKDPWELLDPHSYDDPTYMPKPLKKGKTFRLPDGIFQPPSECVTGARTTRITQPQVRSLNLLNVIPSLAVEAFRVVTGEQLESTVKIANHGLVYGNEFLYITKESAKLRAAKHREEKEKQQKSTSKLHRTIGSVFDADNDYDDDRNDFGGGFGGDDDEYDDEGNNTGGNTGFDSLNDVFGGSQNGKDDGTFAISRIASIHANLTYLVLALSIKILTDLSSGKTFEDLCRAHIEAFAKGAEKFALSTILTERVSKWQEKLAPILAEEEQRASFDIHRYSEKLIENALEGLQRGKRKSDGSLQLQANSTSVGFSTVTRGCTQSDVCRFFLTSLSLANAGNLFIEDESDDFRFQVISQKLEKPMESYRAPSLGTNWGQYR